MANQHDGINWGVREQNMWWAGNVANDQHQNYMPQQPQQQQQMGHSQSQIDVSSSSNTQQVYSYKMTSGFQNAPTSPVGAMGVRGYDYRPGDGMTGGNPTMNMPATATTQWWYPPTSVDNMHTNLQHNIQTPVYNPPTSQSESQTRLEDVQILQQQQLQHQQLQQQFQHNQNNHQTQQQVLQQHQQITNQIQVPKGRMPRAKGDSKPRGRMSAYAFFVQTCSEEHKKKHPEENVIFAEFSKKCAERWKTMLDKEKKRFREMAENDKKRYDSEMQNYTPPKGEKRGKKRKQNKDPNAPKRSLSAFFWFSNDERPKVKGANPEYGVGDIAKELGKRWADADPETKGKYEQLADRDKARYEKEMTAYKKKNNPALQQAPVPDNEEVDDDEENEEDEDD